MVCQANIVQGLPTFPVKPIKTVKATLFCPTLQQGALSNATICPSVCPMPLAQKREHVMAMVTIKKLIGNPMLEVKPSGQAAVKPPEVAETATKSMPAPIQNHSPGGCTVK